MTKTVEVKIGVLSMVQLPEIVTIHVQSFPRSAFTRLGPSAVYRYYEWQFIGPHQAHYLGAWVDNQLGGFCICGEFHGALGGFLARNRRFLEIQILMRPWLLANAEVRSAVVTGVRNISKCARKPRQARAKAQEARKFGVLAIAVAPIWHRHGLGRQLMAKSEQVACEVGVPVMGLTVRPGNDVAVRFYESLGWGRVEAGSAWEGRMEKRLPLRTGDTTS